MVFCGPMWMGNCPLLYWSYFTHLQGKGIAFLSGGGCYRGSRRANLLSISTCLGLVRWGILIDIWCICFINLLTSCGGILICSNSLTECTWIAPLELFYTTYPVFKLGFDVSRNLRKLWKVKKMSEDICTCWKVICNLLQWFYNPAYKVYDSWHSQTLTIWQYYLHVAPEAPHLENSNLVAS